MNNQQIMDMLGIDAKAAQLTREACEGRVVESDKGPVLCGGLGLDVKTAVYAIKCGLEVGGVERKDSGEWLVVDIGLYDFVKEMEAQAKNGRANAGIIHISYEDDYDNWLKNERKGGRVISASSDEITQGERDWYTEHERLCAEERERVQSSMFSDAPATKGTRGAYGGEG